LYRKAIGRLQFWNSQPGRIGTALAVALVSVGCAGPAPAPKPVPALPPAAPLVSDEESTEISIRFFAKKVKEDPANFLAYNKLAGLHLQRLRDTGNVAYLEKALEAARSSLEIFPAEINPDGLGHLASAEFDAHDFRKARDHALQWTRLRPDRSAPFGLLGDACLELGEYADAEKAYREMERSSRDDAIGVNTRWAHWKELHGDLDGALAHLQEAHAAALSLTAPPRELTAWCRWQFGELTFLRGEYAAAEKHYRDALTVYPNYYRAVASLGRTLAALGRREEAIAQYEKATKIFPDPGYVAALGDLYHLAGRQAEADAQYGIVSQISRLGKLNGQLYNRQVVQFLADHDRDPAEAYQQAAEEYESRKDVYGAATLGWAALKAGRIPEARRAAAESLSLNTPDPRLLYQAGMIARAAGDTAEARRLLSQALKQSPAFDPLQAPLARKALEAL